MLEIAVHSDDSIAGRMAQSGGQSCLMAEVAGKGKRFHVLVPLLQVFNRQKRSVGTSIIHKQYLEGIREVFDRFCKMIEQQGNILHFVQNGNNDGDGLQLLSGRLLFFHDMGRSFNVLHSGGGFPAQRDLDIGRKNRIQRNLQRLVPLLHPVTAGVPSLIK